MILSDSNFALHSFVSWRKSKYFKETIKTRSENCLESWFSYDHGVSIATGIEPGTIALKDRELIHSATESPLTIIMMAMNMIMMIIIVKIFIIIVIVITIPSPSSSSVLLLLYFLAQSLNDFFTICVPTLGIWLVIVSLILTSLVCLLRRN